MLGCRMTYCMEVLVSSNEHQLEAETTLPKTVRGEVGCTPLFYLISIANIEEQCVVSKTGFLPDAVSSMTLSVFLSRRQVLPPASSDCLSAVIAGQAWLSYSSFRAQLGRMRMQRLVMLRGCWKLRRPQRPAPRVFLCQSSTAC